MKLTQIEAGPPLIIAPQHPPEPLPHAWYQAQNLVQDQEGFNGMTPHVYSRKLNVNDVGVS